jgi:excisionase family DNA binding protein
MVAERQTEDVRPAAVALGVSERHLRTLIARGAVPAFRLGHRVLIPKAWLRNILEGSADPCDKGDAGKH